MSNVIVYQNDVGGVSVIHPTQEAIDVYGIEEIALKDVPTGKLFKIIEASDLPKDRSQRAAWTVDLADLTDGIGAEWSEFPEALK